MPARQQSSPLPDSRGATLSVWRISLFMFAVASVVWLGAVNVRALIGNDILNPGTVELLDYISPQAEREVYRLLSISSIAVIAGYSVALISSVVFLASSPFRLKQHGWLMMSAILFYVFVPVEVYTMYMDWKMMYLEFFTTAENDVFRELFLARIKALQGVPLIAVLCYYTIIGLAVFQPFKAFPVQAAGRQLGHTA